MNKTMMIFMAVLLVFVSTGIVNAEVFDDIHLNHEYEVLKKNPLEGLILSLIVPGGGYYYAENYDKSLKNGALELATLLGVVLLNNEAVTLGYLGVKAYNMYDSYKEVEAYNQRLLERLSLKVDKNETSLSVYYEF